MTYDFKDFYDVIKENLENYEGVYVSFIDYGPDLFNLLCKLLYVKSIDNYSRLKLNAAIAYYVIPLDRISEQRYGPYGYIDDIFLTVYVLRDMADKYGYDFLQKYWDGDNNIQIILNECYNKSLEFLNDDIINDILKHAGLIK